ncbi:MAG: hypothetical protein CVT66_10700 [Actinobacteria bacterium HGW-Actinobacteria-6]|nr:MAG: hypothetical protein CVV34_03195 [Methanomicrobiales archaeon HGW-Methanomicrobiales-5]PKQ19325.1 MAG: hypothetical protein CVT66_10700 [Actinobacteria bacterium HGW-Actinobacteria-6]
MKASLRTVVLGLVVVVLSGCAVAPMPRVTLGGQAVDAYLADTMAKRSQGLQGFDGLADGEALLFVYPDERVRTFGMKDVGFPIDVVFIGTDNKVTAVVSLYVGDARKIQSPNPSRYVLELPQGWAAAHDITVGSPFTYDDGR